MRVELTIRLELLESKSYSAFRRRLYKKKNSLMLKFWSIDFILRNKNKAVILFKFKIINFADLFPIKAHKLKHIK